MIKQFIIYFRANIISIIISQEALMNIFNYQFLCFFFIIVPCILISVQFIHQQMHSLLNLAKF